MNNINNITITKTDGQELPPTEFIQCEEGSRLWAFKMLGEGKKLTNREWKSYPKGHIFLNSNTLVNGLLQSNAIFYFNKGGWELYKNPFTTLRELIDKEIDGTFRNLKNKIFYKKVGDTISTGVPLPVSLKHIIKILDDVIELL